MTTKLTLFGAGKIGEAIVHLLGRTGDYQLRVVDSDAARLAPMKEAGAQVAVCDIRDEKALANQVAGQDVVISASPYYLTPAIAKAARDHNAHYFDLTEDVESTRAVKGSPKGADTRLHPAVRPRARLHLDRGARPRATLRHAARRPHARRRAADRFPTTRSSTT